MSTPFDCLSSVTCHDRGTVPTVSRRTQSTRVVIRNAVPVVFLLIALAACSDQDRTVVLSDEAASRTLVYQYGKGFIPQAKVPDDVPVLFHSMQLAMSDAQKDGDILTVTTLLKAWKQKDFRTLERTVVEFRFRKIQQGTK